jgi:CBS-domain-containing membrane protein
VLGPLPKIYRVLVSVAALLVFVGVGAWAAYLLPYDVLVSVGASVGLALGAITAYLLLHPPKSTT